MIFSNPGIDAIREQITVREMMFRAIRIIPDSNSLMPIPKVFISNKEINIIPGSTKSPHIIPSLNMATQPQNKRLIKIPIIAPTVAPHLYAGCFFPVNFRSRVRRVSKNFIFEIIIF